MGCEFSRVFVWWSKPGRKRLSSGDSDFRQDSDEKADDQQSDQVIDRIRECVRGRCTSGRTDSEQGPVTDRFESEKSSDKDRTKWGDGPDVDSVECSTSRQTRIVEPKKSRLRKMFSRKKSQKKSKKALVPGKSSYDCSSMHGSSVESDAECAVRNRNAELVLRLMRQGGDGFELLSGAGHPHKFNPVELACSLGYFDIVEVFLDNGCSPNLPTTAGKLLHTVLESIKSRKDCLEQGRKLVKHLICLGCDVDIKDRGGMTPLMYCAEIGDHELMGLVLDRCSDRQLTCQCSGSLYTPLHMSAMRGDFECVKLLISRSPHKHVNEKDKAFNTALHLALKSMLHNIPYLNAAKENLEFGATQQNKETAAACQRLMSFQQNAVAIVEALVMAGAQVHAHCCHPSPVHRSMDMMEEYYYPLVYALQLCARDQTLGFELDPDRFSSTLNLVSRKTMQSLEDLGKMDAHQVQFMRSSATAQETDGDGGKFSPYAGVVRLLVLAGTEMSAEMQKILYGKFDSPSLHVLLDEVCAFWDRYQVSRPSKLVHLAKQVIRVQLASVHRLHRISCLPLPPRIKDYLKLNYL